jgi:hypothetical protein
MALNGACNVLGEVGIDGCRRVFGKQRDALRNRAANWLGGMKDGNWPSVILDDDFRTRAHSGQQRRNIRSGGLRLRDSDDMLAHKIIIRLATAPRQLLVLGFQRRETSRLSPLPPKRLDQFLKSTSAKAEENMSKPKLFP